MQLQRSHHYLSVLGALALVLSFGAQARDLLTYQTLTTGTQRSTVDMRAFTPDVGAAAATHRFEGRLTLTGRVSSRTLLANRDLVDDAAIRAARTFPQDFDYQFVQHGDAIIPVRRGLIPGTHAWWEFILEPGKVWDEAHDEGFTRAAIPFSLQQKNANCTHNGVLTFLFKRDGSVSRTALQISSETCAYLQFDMWGLLDTTYTPAAIANAATIAGAYEAEVAARLPTRPLAQLAADHPAANPGAFAIGRENSRTAYGFLLNDIHYVSNCETRQGIYPFCDVLGLPSYSVAKSAFAGLALMRLQALYPDASKQLISAYVPECQGAAWAGVTLRHALDMTTGNFDSATYMVDEDAVKIAGFFDPPDHAAKIAWSCNAYPRKASPGEKWVYHTPDTYIVGAALTRYLKSLPGRERHDIHDDVLVADLWRPLRLSPVTFTTQRTFDRTAQPLAGFGLTFHRDDLVRLANFLHANGRLNGTQLLDAGMVSRALQRDGSDRGLQAGADPVYRYAHGFWARNVKPLLKCATDTWVPFMSGYGGISVVLMPNGSVYYNVSDGGHFDWSAAARASHAIRPLCN